MKQILLTMNEKQSFIIEDLDDHHLVIKADEEWRVKRELEAEVCPPSLFSHSPLSTSVPAREEHLQPRIMPSRPACQAATAHAVPRARTQHR